MLWVKLRAKNPANETYYVWLNLDCAVHLEERDGGTRIYFREGPPPETFTVLEKPDAVLSQTVKYSEQYREG